MSVCNYMCNYIITRGTFLLKVLAVMILSIRIEMIFSKGVIIISRNEKRIGNNEGTNYANDITLLKVSILKY